MDAPRWWFLHHLIRRGFLVHGSNNTAIDEFEPRGNFDAHNVRRVEGVFASDDAIWPIYFATADRTGGRRGLINWCEHAGGGRALPVRARRQAVLGRRDGLRAAGRHVRGDTG